MGYTIPTNANEREKEMNRLLRSAATQEEFTKMERTLKWLADYATGKIAYSDRSYRDLYSVYKAFGLTEGKKKDQIFPEGNRNREDFQNRLGELWRTFEIRTRDRIPTIAESFQRYRRNQEVYDDQLRGEERALQERNRRPAPEPPEEKLKENTDWEILQAPEAEGRTLPLVDRDRNSEYFNFVEGSAYSELNDLWKDLRGKIDTERDKMSGMLADDMGELLYKMQFHYIVRNMMGDTIPMTQAEHKELHSLYQNCLDDCRLLSEKVRITPEFKKLNALLSNNEIQLKNLPVDNLPPLSEAVHGMKGETIYLTDRQEKGMGGVLSDRKTVEYVDETGNVRQGFFTADQTVGNQKKEYDSIVDRFCRSNPELREYSSKFKKLSGDDEFYRVMSQVLKFELNENENAAKNVADSYVKNKDWFDSEDQNDRNFKNKFKEMTLALATAMNASNLMKKSGLHEGDHIAERAAAMSDVASALGYPEMLVGSRRVTVKYGDKEIPGVMMDPAGADLVDPSNISTGHPFFDMDPTQYDGKEMLSSLADLQVIDYLCGNTDRHGHNFFMRMDFTEPEKPKLLGVQGIDNDNSFGDLKKGGVHNLAKSENLKIITPKMADAISNMKAEQLQSILSPYQLSEAQVSAAKYRLKKLQSMIKNGREEINLPLNEAGKIINRKESIHIVKDEEWEKLTLDSLIPAKELTLDSPFSAQDLNIFAIANNKRQLLANTIKKQKKDKEFLEQYEKFDEEMKKDFAGEKKEILQKMENEKKAREERKDKHISINYSSQDGVIDENKLNDMQKEEYEHLKALQQEFKDARGDSRNRSNEFRTMQDALNDFAKEYGSLINSAQEGKKPEDVYKEIEKKRQTLKTAVDQYLNKRHWKIVKSDNNKLRINTAERLFDAVKDAPKSEKYYMSSQTVKAEQENRMMSTDPVKQNSYLAKMIGENMKLVMRRNVDALDITDPKHVLGIKALSAQERLWKYSQSSVSMASLSVKKSGSREQIPFPKLVQNVSHKKKAELEAGNTNDGKVREDLETICAYAPEMEKTIGKLLESREKITPLRVKEVMESLFLNETKTENTRKAAMKAKAAGNLLKQAAVK